MFRTSLSRCKFSNVKSALENLIPIIFLLTKHDFKNVQFFPGACRPGLANKSAECSDIRFRKIYGSTLSAVGVRH